MTILPKAVYRLNTISYQITNRICHKIRTKFVYNLYENTKDPE